METLKDLNIIGCLGGPNKKVVSHIDAIKMKWNERKQWLHKLHAYCLVTILVRSSSSYWLINYLF